MSYQTYFTKNKSILGVFSEPAFITFVHTHQFVVLVIIFPPAQRRFVGELEHLAVEKEARFR